MENRVEQSVVLRKRGRPTGKHRVPLSKEERRARNAQYERERRGEMSDALDDLAAAAGCNHSMTNADLLATVITQLRLASQIKHSQDLESLRRCNKNLMAQIANLEQRLAEPDECPLPLKKEVPRPLKRKREYEPQAEGAGYAQVPKLSPPEYTPPPALSPEQNYLPGPRASSVYFSEESHSPVLQPTPTPEFEQHYPEVQPSDHGFQPTSQLLQYPTTSTQFLPVAKISPASSTSDQTEECFDYSAYQFAGPQIPTPEYQIPSEPSEYPEASCSHGQYYGYHPLQCHSGPSSPEDQFPSAQSFVPPMQYEVPLNPPLPILPNQPVVVGSVGIPPMPGNSILPDIGEAGFGPHHVNFLSTEDLISVYL